MVDSSPEIFWLIILKINKTKKNGMKRTLTLRNWNEQTARIKNFQSPSSFSPITARFASNFLVDADPEADPVLQTDIMQGSIQDLRVNTEGVTVNIGPGRGGIRYNQAYTGRQVQINGKTRGVVKFEADVSMENVIKSIMENDSFKKYFYKKSIIKEVYVPKRLVNFVTK